MPKKFEQSTWWHIYLKFQEIAWNSCWKTGPDGKMWQREVWNDEFIFFSLCLREINSPSLYYHTFYYGIYNYLLHILKPDKQITVI